MNLEYALDYRYSRWHAAIRKTAKGDTERAIYDRTWNRPEFLVTEASAWIRQTLEEPEE